VSEDGTYLEQIESDEIKKLVELIYGSKPEDAIEVAADIEDHKKIIEQVDHLIENDLQNPGKKILQDIPKN